MLSAVLVTALTTVSGGLLSETPVHARHARFIETPLAFAGGMVAGARAPAKPVDLMSLEELRYARAYEEDNKPGIVGPIVLTAIGAALIVTAVIVMGAVVVPAFTALTAANILAAYLGIIGFAVAGIAGTVLLIVGLVKLGKAIGGAAKSSRRLKDIDARIAELEASPQPIGPQAPPPLPVDAPEPPPPPPPEQGFNTRVFPGLALATF